MDRSYDRERLIDKIMAIYDPNYIDRHKYENLKKLVDDDIDNITINKTRLEKLVASLQDDYLLITFDVTTNITNEGHDDDGTLWIDLSVSIDDVVTFIKWLQDTFDDNKSIKCQEDIEELIQAYLGKHKVNFGDIGLRVTDYVVN